ncbi:unnamed protein product [Phaeothamnion confervicola]
MTKGPQYASFEVTEESRTAATQIQSPPGPVAALSRVMDIGFKAEEYELLDEEGGSGLQPPHRVGAWRRQRRRALRDAAAFFSIGLINNAGYVIMMAAAKDIEGGGVGYVFLADVLPSFIVKLTGPYCKLSCRHVLRSLFLDALSLFPSSRHQIVLH